MSLQLKEYQGDKEAWDRFVATHAFDGGLLQSWDWVEAKKIDSLLLKRWQILNDKGEIVLQTHAWIQPWAKFFRYLYIPRGPVISSSFIEDQTLLTEALSLLWKTCEEWAQVKKAVFVRVDWPYSSRLTPITLLKSSSFIEAKRSVQPPQTLIMDLRKGEDELLKGMKQKTRYNIRLAQKKGIQVTKGSSEKELKIFLDLLGKTGARHQINFFGKNYFENILKQYSNNEVQIWVAEYQGVPIAANFNMRFGNTEYYLFGASDYQYRNLMGTSLLQWEAIKAAKQVGIEFYDFWGVSSDDGGIKDQQWAGFTKFKKGFVPNTPTTYYLGTWEKIYRERIYKLGNLLIRK